MNFTGGSILLLVSLGLFGCAELPYNGSSASESPFNGRSKRAVGSPKASAGGAGIVETDPLEGGTGDTDPTNRAPTDVVTTTVDTPTDPTPLAIDASTPSPDATVDVPSGKGTLDGTEATPSVALPYPSCPIHPTTRLAIRANLDSTATVPTASWDPQDPANTANFSDTLTLIDTYGHPVLMDIYFRKERDAEFSYHVLIGNAGQNLEIGTGELKFDTEGRLASWTAALELRLPSYAGTGDPDTEIQPFFGHSIASGGTGADGITQYSAASNVLSHWQDGHPGIVGRPCTQDAVPDQIGPWPAADHVAQQGGTRVSRVADACLPVSSHVLAFGGNLNASVALLSEPWDRLHPYETSSAATMGRVRNRQNDVAILDVYFRHEASHRYSYHVLLNSTVPGIELGSGELTFSAWGTLSSVRELVPLRFPNPDGTAGEAISLLFQGPVFSNFTSLFELRSSPVDTRITYGLWDPVPTQPTVDCIDGLTLATVEYSPHSGWASIPYFPHRTSIVTLSAWLGTNTPITTALPDSAAGRHGATSGPSRTVYDALGRPSVLTPYFFRRDLFKWDVYLLQTETPMSTPVLKFTSTLTFNESGHLARTDSPSYFSLSSDAERDDGWVDVHFAEVSVTRDCLGDQVCGVVLSDDGATSAADRWFLPI